MTDESKRELTSRVVRGGGWLYCRHLLTNAFNVIVIAVLARQLAPADFGVVALANVILGFLAILGPAGIGDYIVYDRKSGREERVHACFWLTVALTTAAVAFGVVVVPYVSLCFNLPAFTSVLYALLAQFAIGQIGTVPDALMRRALDFKSLALRETILEIVNGAAMMGMALGGCGIWSLILPAIIIAPIRVLAAFRLSGWLPRFGLRTDYWSQILRYSFQSMGSSVVTLVANQGDTLLIGNRFGAADVGFYNQAWTNANLVNRNVASVVAKVAMPALSAVSENRDRLRSALFRMLSIIGLASFPLLLGLLVVADLFIQTLYGPNWQPSVLPLQILTLFALRQTVGSPATVIYNVVGRPDIGLRMGLVFLPFYLLSIWLGSFHGIVGVASAVTIVRFIYGMIQFQVIARLVGGNLRALLSPMAQPFSAALLMATVVLACRWMLSAMGVASPLLLVLLILTGGLTWLLILLRIFPQSMHEILMLVDALSTRLGSQLRRFVLPLMSLPRRAASTL